MTNYLPYDLLKKAMSYINWQDSLISEHDEQQGYRPKDVKGTLEEMIDLFMAYPYVKDVPYFVASTPKEKGNTSQSFVRFYGGREPKFLAMCYFPEMADIHTVLPTEAFGRLPEYLWKERGVLPCSRFDSRAEVCIKDGDYVVFIDNNGLLQEDKFQLNPTFGGCIRSKVQKVMTTHDLRDWLSTKEGKDFQRVECLSVLKEKAPKFYDAYTQCLTGDQIIKSLEA